LQGIAHVAEEEEFGRRQAVRMRRKPALEDVDFSVRKELAQMVVGPAVAEPELEHVAVQILDQAGREIEAGALSLQPADKTVEPAHGRLGVDAGLLAQSVYLVARGAELSVG
jgi:hypothetical protein